MNKLESHIEWIEKLREKHNYEATHNKLGEEIIPDEGWEIYYLQPHLDKRNSMYSEPNNFSKVGWYIEKTDNPEIFKVIERWEKKISQKKLGENAN